jgi:hypothetical protein
MSAAVVSASARASWIASLDNSGAWRCGHRPKPEVPTPATTTGRGSIIGGYLHQQVPLHFANKIHPGLRRDGLLAVDEGQHSWTVVQVNISNGEWWLAMIDGQVDRC